MLDHIEVNVPVIRCLAPHAHLNIYTACAVCAHTDKGLVSISLKYLRYLFERLVDSADSLPVIRVVGYRKHVVNTSEIGFRNIYQHCVGRISVWYIYRFVVQRHKLCVEDIYAHNSAFNSGNAYVVAYFERLGDKYKESARNIGEAVLERKTDRYTGGTDDCDYRCCRHSEKREYHGYK